MKYATPRLAFSSAQILGKETYDKNNINKKLQ